MGGKEIIGIWTHENVNQVQKLILGLSSYDFFCLSSIHMLLMNVIDLMIIFRLLVLKVKLLEQMMANSNLQNMIFPLKNVENIVVLSLLFSALYLIEIFFYMNLLYSFSSQFVVCGWYKVINYMAKLSTRWRLHWLRLNYSIHLSWKLCWLRFKKLSDLEEE